jgi:hypothetical protein
LVKYSGIASAVTAHSSSRCQHDGARCAAQPNAKNQSTVCGRDGSNVIAGITTW